MANTYQNWLIMPAGRGAGQVPVTSPLAQPWLLVLTGVWTMDTTNQFSPDPGSTVAGGPWSMSLPEMVAPDVTAPLWWALDHYGIPYPSRETATPCFQLESSGGAAPFANICGVYDNPGFKDPLPVVGAGCLVESCSVESTPVLDLDGTQINVFGGVLASIRVRNVERVMAMNYNVTLLGRAVFTPKS